jgi:hypothetical protein
MHGLPGRRYHPSGAIPPTRSDHRAHRPVDPYGELHDGRVGRNLPDGLPGQSVFGHRLATRPREPLYRGRDDPIVKALLRCRQTIVAPVDRRECDLIGGIERMQDAARHQYGHLGGQCGRIVSQGPVLLPTSVRPCALGRRPPRELFEGTAQLDVPDDLFQGLIELLLGDVPPAVIPRELFLLRWRLALHGRCPEKPATARTSRSERRPGRTRRNVSDSAP